MDKMPKGESDAEASAQKHLLILLLYHVCIVDEPNGDVCAAFIVFAVFLCLCSHNEYP